MFNQNEVNPNINFYNVITKDDSIEVINEKLRTETYTNLNDEEIHELLLNEATYDSNIFAVRNGKVIRREFL